MSVRRIAWFVVVLSGVAWGVTPHAQSGPVPPAQVLPPAFSYDLALPDPDACICLPPYMLQAPNAEHHWWAKATGDGPLDVHVIGLGINPAEAGTPGGGSGGAIYNDGNTIHLNLCGTRIEDNQVNAYGSAIFFVSNDHSGTLTVRDSVIRNNTGGGWNVLPGISMHEDTTRTIENSVIE